jgi:simple sugar transport system permease protein
MTAGIAALLGASPLAALLALGRGALGTRHGLTESLLEAIPLLLTGLGVALAFRCRLWNIGAEGQLLVGSLAAVTLGVSAGAWPGWLLLPAVLGAGMLAGAVWAAAAALLRVYRGVPEVIATIMLNFVALYLVSWAVTGPLKQPGQEVPQTALIPEAARLATFAGGLHAGVGVGVLAVVLTTGLLFYTVPGFRMRVVGQSPEAARAAGLPVPATLLLGFALSGALAGLAGAVQLAGVTYRVYAGSSPGTGYAAIAVALLGRLHPAGVLLSALFFGALVAGSNEMQRTAGISSVIAAVIQAVILLLLISLPRAGGRVPRRRPTKGTDGGAEHQAALDVTERGS